MTAIQTEPGIPATAWRRLFFGLDGLRAGWSLALFLSPFALLAGVGLLVRHLLAPAAGATAAPAAAMAMTPSVTIVGEMVTFGAVAVVAFVVSLVEKRPFPRYGLSLRGAGRDFLTGLGWGAALLTLLIVLLRARHAIVFAGLALHGVEAVGYGLAWAGAFLCVALFEEFFFRGFLQFTLARGVSGLVHALAPRSRHAHAIGFWVAALVLSVGLFVKAHTGNAGETPAGVAAVGLAGAVFVFSLWRTGTLWWAIGFHTAWDWAQTYLYGTADSGNAAHGHLLTSAPAGPALWSGGSAGPEGSVLVLPVLLVAALVIARTLPRRDYPLTPSQTPAYPVETEEPPGMPTEPALD